MQVDPAWLSNRKYGGPSPEDMAVLDLPDPLVPLRLSCCASQLTAPTRAASLGRTLRADDYSQRAEGRSRATQEYKYNSEFGLRHSTDPDSLQQRFRSDVNMDQVFGKFDALGAYRRNQSSEEQFSRNGMLGMISSASVF